MEERREAEVEVAAMEVSMWGRGSALAVALGATAADLHQWAREFETAEKSTKIF